MLPYCKMYKWDRVTVDGSLSHSCNSFHCVLECGHIYKQQLEEQKFKEFSHGRDGLRSVFAFRIPSNQINAGYIYNKQRLER